MLFLKLNQRCPYGVVFCFQEFPGPNDDGKSREDTLRNIMVFMSSKGDLYLGMLYEPLDKDSIDCMNHR